MVGKRASPVWLATDATLHLFDSNRYHAIKEYIEFVANGKGLSIWDNLQQQVFLGDDDFIEKHLNMQNELTGNLREIPFKQSFIIHG